MDSRDVALYRRDLVFAPGAPPIDAHTVLLDGTFEAHSHEFVEIVVIDGGTGLHRTLHGDRPFRPGDLFVLRPGAWHAYRECAGLRVHNCCFGLELLERELAWLQEEPGPNYLCWAGPLAPERRGILFGRLDSGALAACTERLDALHRAVRGTPPAGRAEQVALLLLALATLAAQVRPGTGRAAPRIHEAVVRGMRLLDADPARPWTLGDLAGAVHLHRSYLVRLFRAQIGLAPMAYLAHRRAERAATLVLYSDRSMGEIGREVGWPDPNYFGRRFRAYFGLSATAYRARHAGAAQADRTHIRPPAPSP